jgi:hypothetical protein
MESPYFYLSLERILQLFATEIASFLRIFHKGLPIQTGRYDTAVNKGVVAAAAADDDDDERSGFGISPREGVAYAC